MEHLSYFLILVIILILIAAFMGAPEKLLRKVAKRRRLRINELKKQLKELQDSNNSTIGELLQLEESYGNLKTGAKNTVIELSDKIVKLEKQIKELKEKHDSEIDSFTESIKQKNLRIEKIVDSLVCY